VKNIYKSPLANLEYHSALVYITTTTTTTTTTIIIIIITEYGS
jgi:hypothetical protein